MALLVALAAVVVVVVVAVVAVPSRPVEAELMGPWDQRLPDVPTSAIAQRWTLDLGPSDDVALVADLVIVLAPGQGPGGGATVTARDVRTEATVWQRRLRQPSMVLVVDDRGATTTMYGSASAVGSVEPQRLAALDVDDGRLLWDRPVSFVIGSSAGHVLLATDDGCDLVEARTGRTTWREWTQGCLWLDDDEVMASRRGGWEVHAVDGTTTRRLPGTVPPAAVGQFVAAVDDDELVLVDRGGDERWRARLGSAATPGRVWPGGLPGVGVVVFSEPDTGPRAEAFDLDGHPLDGVGDLLPGGQVVEVDGTSYAVAPWRDGDEVVLSIRPLHDLDRDLGVFASPHTVVARQGVLEPSPSGDHLEFLAWPDLASRWSVDLAAVIDLHGGWDRLLTSRVGVVVVASNPRTVYAHG